MTAGTHGTHPTDFDASYRAIAAISDSPDQNGIVFVSIYNDDGFGVANPFHLIVACSVSAPRLVADGPSDGTYEKK